MSILIEREIPPAALRRGSRIPKWLSKRSVDALTAEYKLRIVREADAFGKGDGDVAALLRREGLLLVAIIELASPT